MRTGFFEQRSRVRNLHRKINSRPVWTLDCETDPFHNCDDKACSKCHGGGRVPQPFKWGAYDGEDYETFSEADGVAEHFSTRKALVYAHNGGKFDYHYLRDYINSDEPIMLINGRLSRFKIGECEFRDSLNIFPNTRLADFGVKNEIDYELMEPTRRNDPNIASEIEKYLRQDCIGLHEVVTRYRNEYGTKLTQASASMKKWEQMSGLDAPRQTLKQYERYKPYYYGGRVQCFESGVASTQFKVADINSAYPYAMLREHMFSPHAMRQRHLPPEPAIYKCLIKLDCTSRGAFPWRDPKTGELFFPDDEAGNRNRMRTYTITGWEFMTALELDLVENIVIRDCHVFGRTVNFKDYIDHFYELRMEAAAKGDKAGKIFGKYFMNSLYGKFGANCRHYAEYVIATSDSIEQWKAKGYLKYKEWGERTLMERKPTDDELDDPDGKWRFYNVATAASVTGFVRAHLLRAIHQSGGVIYCDTDSVAARDVSALDFGSSLGQWKDEGRFDRYAIAGKKLYAFHVEGESFAYNPKDEKNPTWKIASKGVNFNRLPNGPDLLSRIANGETITFNPESPCYSVTRTVPKFIARDVQCTAKDMSQAPDVGPEKEKILGPDRVRF